MQLTGTGHTSGSGVNAGTHPERPRLSTLGPAPHTCMLLAYGDEVGRGRGGGMGAEDSRKSGAAGGPRSWVTFVGKRGGQGGRCLGAITSTGRMEIALAHQDLGKGDSLLPHRFLKT